MYEQSCVCDTNFWWEREMSIDLAVRTCSLPATSAASPFLWLTDLISSYLLSWVELGSNLAFLFMLVVVRSITRTLSYESHPKVSELLILPDIPSSCAEIHRQRKEELNHPCSLTTTNLSNASTLGQRKKITRAITVPKPKPISPPASHRQAPDQDLGEEYTNTPSRCLI